MSEFIAEAQVLVVPNTAAFAVSLKAQVEAAIARAGPVAIPVVPVTVGGAGAATGALNTLNASQSKLIRTSQEVAGAQDVVRRSTEKSTAALLGAKDGAAKLDAALLGLRTAAGSAAVIGLGAVALAAIAAGQALRGMLIQTAQFQQELATFRATTGASADEIERVSEAAKRLGADVRLPAVSAADAAIAMTELAKAGLSVEESIAGAEGVLQLATAAQLSNADAAKIAANALNSFGLAGDQATRVADDFANAANAAQGSIADIGLALQQSSAVARQVGLSLEDTTAILSLFARNGLQGSDAGTSLRVALIRLVAPTQQAAAEIEKLGLRIRDTQGNVRPDVFAQFGQATKDIGPAARDAAAALIFGQDAIRAVAIGAREGADGLRQMQFEIDQQGTAAEVASARTEGLAGSFAALQSNIQTLGISLGGIVAGPLNVFLTAINDALSTTTQLVDSLTKLGKIKVPEINVNVGINLHFGGGRAGDIAGQVKDAVSNAVGTALVNAVIGPAGGFAVRAEVLAKALAGVGKGADDSKQKIAELNKELRAFQQARAQANAGGDTQTADRLTKRIEALKLEVDALRKTGEGIDTGVNVPLRKSLETLEKLRETARGQDVPFIDALIARVKEQIPLTETAAANAGILRDSVDQFGKSAVTAASGADILAASLKNLNAQAFAANSALLKLQNEGAGPQAQIANLQGQRKIQEDKIAAIKSNGNQSDDATRINAARTEINRIQAQIDSLQQGIVSDQKAAAASAKKAADEAQKARDEQFQHLADLFGGRQQNIEDQISRAGIVGNIDKEQRLNKALIASIKKEIKTLQERLKSVKISAALRKSIFDALNRALEAARQDTIRFQQEQAKNLKDFATPKIDLRIRIAQARDDVKAEISLRKQRLALLTAEILKLARAGKKNTTAWLELKAQQAEEQKAIEDLEKKTKDKKGAEQSFFKFLQTQQGFAANLLGNLIPGFATRGLVGGSPADAGTQSALLPGAQIGDTRTQVQGQAALAGSRDRGVRPVQVDTTNHLLRQILRSLQNLNGRAASPEARYQKNVAGGMMDTL